MAVPLNNAPVEGIGGDFGLRSHSTYDIPGNPLYAQRHPAIAAAE